TTRHRRKRGVAKGAGVRSDTIAEMQINPTPNGAGFVCVAKPQDRAMQDRAMQDRAMQDRAMQDRAMQDRAMQEIEQSKR
ncbi:MAG: hypothetical protein ACXVP2_11300, partial [Tumebacillaceae bacterium]